MKEERYTITNIEKPATSEMQRKFNLAIDLGLTYVSTTLLFLVGGAGLICLLDAKDIDRVILEQVAAGLGVLATYLCYTVREAKEKANNEIEGVTK